MNKIKKIQSQRSSLVKEKDYLINPKIALAISVQQINRKIRGGGILYDINTQSQLDSHLGTMTSSTFPYIPTFLSLRNKQSAKEIISFYQGRFDLLLVEGSGRQHPRSFGLACELGVDFEIPTIGITQNSLWGNIDFSQTIDKKGFSFDIHPVFADNTLIAYFIRKKLHKKGVFISIGHKVSLLTALDIILPHIVFRVPEPIRIVKSLLKKG
ncbi:MAG: endonuclease V [Candidatus Hodarchaeales archaeon]